jgi:hypothetical protein
MVGSVEGFWRSRGWAPTGRINPARSWVLARSEVHGDDPDVVVFVGTSRTRLGIDADEFAAAVGGRRPDNLGIDGQSPVPVLDHLGRDRSFRGTVYCEFHPAFWFRDASTARQLVKDYEARKAVEELDLALESLVARSLIVRDPRLTPTWEKVQLWKVHGEWPRPPEAGGASAEPPEDVVRRAQPRPSPEQVAALKDELGRAVRAIHDRGGRVIFHHPPVSGTVRQVEEELFPRPAYFDVLTDHPGTVRVHYADDAVLSALHCPDGSHLDATGGRVYSRVLAAVRLRAREQRTERPPQ